MTRAFSVIKFFIVAFLFLTIVGIGTFVSAQEEVSVAGDEAGVVALTEAELSLIANVDEATHVRRFFPDTSEADARQVYHAIVFAGEDVNDRAVVARYLEERKEALAGSSTIYPTVIESVSSVLVSEGVYDVTFTLANNGPTQSGIKYRVSLKPITSDSSKPLFKYSGPETITVDSGVVYKKTIRLEVPGYVEGGDYLWLVELGGVHGIVNDMKGDSLTTTISDRDVVFKIDPLNCYLEIPGESQTYTLLEGVDIKPEESLLLKCPVQNLTGEPITLDVYQTTRYRSSWGDVVSEGVYQNNPIEIGAEAGAVLSLTINGNQVPQAYDIIFSFKSANREVLAPLEAHYVVYGRSATIHNVTLDRNGYVLGDDAVIGLAWSGSANNFPGSRFEPINQELSVSFKLTNKDGLICGAADNLPLSNAATHALDTLKVLVVNDCNSLILETSIFGADGELLAYSSNNFSGGEYVDGAEEVTAATTNWKTSTIIISLVGFIGTIVLVLWLRRRNRIVNIVASFVLVTASILAGASVYAGSFYRDYSIWDVPEQNWSPHPVTVTFNGPAGTYVGSQLITFSGHLSNGVCANIAARSWWTVRIYNPGGAQVFSNQSQIGVAPYSNSWRANQFSGSGTYRGVITWEDTGCQTILGNPPPNPPANPNNNNQCNVNPAVSETFYFSVVAPPAITLTAAPSTIDPGGSSVISWSVVDATSCSASGGWSGSRNRSGGTQGVNPAATTNYRLDCSGPGGNTSRTVTVTVRPPTVTFTAVPTLIGPGNSSTLTWTTSGATSCTANGGPWSGGKALAGNESVSPAVTTVYGLRCTGPSGTTDRTATVTLPSGSLTASQCWIQDNQSSCLSSVSWRSQNFLGTRSVRQGSTEFGTTADGDTTRSISPDDRIFTLRDNGSAYIITREASVSCQQPNSIWVSEVPACVPLPVIDIESNPNIVRSGNTAPIEITILANYELTCTITGGINQTFTHNPSATTITHNFTTNPLRSAQIVTVSCVSPTYPDLMGDAETRIEVIPTVQEI